MDLRPGLRARRSRAPGPGTASAALSWVGEERIAISGVPSRRAVACLAEQGVTHVVNCRPRAQVLRYRPQAQLVPAYVRSVERWLAAAAR